MSNNLIVFAVGCALSFLALMVYHVVKEDRELTAACEARGGVPVPLKYNILCLAPGAVK